MRALTTLLFCSALAAQATAAPAPAAPAPIPAALAGMLMGVGAPEAKLIVSVTFLAVLMTILIQATTTRWLAEKLDLLVEE